MSKKRTDTPDEKVAVIRRHLLEGVAVSDLCDELKIQPTQYYAWQTENCLILSELIAKPLLEQS